MLSKGLLKVFSFVLLITLEAACITHPFSSPQDAKLRTNTTSPLSTAPQGLQTPQSKYTLGVISPIQPRLDHVFNLILGRPTANSITASMFAQTTMQIRVLYGTALGDYSSQVGPLDLKPGVPQNLELKGLLPDTAYYYLLIENEKVLSEHTFHTQRQPGSNFTFTIDSDPHNRDPRFSGELYAITLKNALNAKPDFHINLGDTFMTEKLKAGTYLAAESTFTDLRPYFGIIGADVPLFLVNGNHEGELGWLLKGNESSLPIWSTQLRQLYYPNPTTSGFYTGSSTPDLPVGVRDSYYAWTWGDALFVVLDPFWYTTSKPKPGDLNNNWDWTLGKEQYDWLRATLEGSQAKFKFIFIHHLVGGYDKGARGGIEAAPYFEWGGKNADGSYGFDEYRPGWGTPIHQLLVENHVNIVFHGHDHLFVKQELDGIVYQEVPQPSNTEYNNPRLAADYGYTHGDVVGSSGHLRVKVSPNWVIVEYVRSYLPRDEKPGQKNSQLDNKYIVYPN